MTILKWLLIAIVVFVAAFFILVKVGFVKSTGWGWSFANPFKKSVPGTPIPPLPQKQY